MLSRISFRIDTSDIVKGVLSIDALGNALDKLARKKNHPQTMKLRSNATRKMKNIVLAFALNVARNANANTPIGDPFRIGSDERYTRLYVDRARRYGIDVDVGYHQGAYSYSETRIPTFTGEIVDAADMIRRIQADVTANYVPKETKVFYIGAKGPAYEAFERGMIEQAPDGVVRPTIDDIMATYSRDVLAAYNKR